MIGQNSTKKGNMKAMNYWEDFSGELIEIEAEIARREDSDCKTVEILFERMKAKKKISKNK